MSKKKSKMGPISVAFPEYLNFSSKPIARKTMRITEKYFYGPF
jgi:hypothetical protein